MEGNRIRDYDLDAIVQRLQAAETRAFDDDRPQDAADFLIAEQIVCILRGDFREDSGAFGSEQETGQSRGS